MNKSPTRPVIASMKTNLIAAAVAAATLTSFAAFADDCDHDDGFHSTVAFTTHAAMPVSPAGHAGRYELRDTQQFVPAHYEQVTVQQCRESRHGWRRNTRCFPVTESRYVPGAYQTVQEWVWVPSYRPQQYSQYPGHRPPMGGQARIGFRFGTR